MKFGDMIVVVVVLVLVVVVCKTPCNIAIGFKAVEVIMCQMVDLIFLKRDTA